MVEGGGVCSIVGRGPGFYVADFRISFPVEKGWLAGRACIDGFGSEELGHLVVTGSRPRRAPAFAGSFVDSVQKPLTQALRDLKENDPGLFEDIDTLVPEVGIRMDSRLSPTTAQVVVVCESAPPGSRGQLVGRVVGHVSRGGRDGRVPYRRSTSVSWTRASRPRSTVP